MDEYIMVYLYNEMTHNNETNERLLHTETRVQKKKLVLKASYTVWLHLIKF